MFGYEPHVGLKAQLDFGSTEHEERNGQQIDQETIMMLFSLSAIYRYTEAHLTLHPNI
jgi:hypothetical protein